MKINSIINPISFGKKLMCKCAVTKDNKQYPCKIYEINYQDDPDYFEKHTDDRWKNSNYWDIAAICFDELSNNDRMFVIEDKKQDCLGFAKIQEDAHNPSYKTLLVIETRPDAAGNNSTKDKRFKYVAETLLAFITGLARNENADNLYGLNVQKEAKKFYEKCHFIHQIGTINNAVLPRESFNSLIKQNEKHTNGHLTYTA